MNEMRRQSGDQAQPLRDLMSRQAAGVGPGIQNGLNRDPRAERAVKIITIASGKGGVGKSSMSVNLAIALSKLGARVLVIDADFGLANVDVMLGVNARYNLSHLLRGEKDIADIIQEGHQGVRFISGGSGVFELLRMDERQLLDIIVSLRKMEDPAEVILIDCGAGVGENVLQLISESSETIIVTTPEPTAILDAYALVKTVLKNDNTNIIRLLMNKCDNRKEGETAIAGLQKVILGHLGVRIEALGHVLYDAEVPKSIKQMTPILISHPNGSTARDIMGVAKTLLNLPEPPPRRNLLSRLFSRWR